MGKVMYGMYYKESVKCYMHRTMKAGYGLGKVLHRVHQPELHHRTGTRSVFIES